MIQENFQMNRKYSLIDVQILAQKYVPIYVQMDRKCGLINVRMGRKFGLISVGFNI